MLPKQPRRAAAAGVGMARPFGPPWRSVPDLATPALQVSALRYRGSGSTRSSPRQGCRKGCSSNAALRWKRDGSGAGPSCIRRTRGRSAGAEAGLSRARFCCVCTTALSPQRRGERGGGPPAAGLRRLTLAALVTNRSLRSGQALPYGLMCGASGRNAGRLLKVRGETIMVAAQDAFRGEEWKLSLVG